MYNFTPLVTPLSPSSAIRRTLVVQSIPSALRSIWQVPSLVKLTIRRALGPGLRIPSSGDWRQDRPRHHTHLFFRPTTSRVDRYITQRTSSELTPSFSLVSGCCTPNMERHSDYVRADCKATCCTGTCVRNELSNKTSAGGEVEKRVFLTYASSDPHAADWK